MDLMKEREDKSRELSTLCLVEQINRFYVYFLGELFMGRVKGVV